MKKFIILCPIAYAVASTENWQDFNNNLYFSSGYSINNATVNSFGSSSNNSASIGIGTSALFDNNVYAKLSGSANFLANNEFVDNWYNVSGKIGYAMNNQYFNLIPYLVGGIGNAAAYYTNTLNYNYGAGILSETLINNQLSLFIDMNYQWQAFSNSINNDFNQRVLDNYAGYSINDNPSSYSITLGIKYITQNGYYISPFFNYQQYQQTFSAQTNTPIDYGNLQANVSQYTLGIDFGWML